MVYKKLIFTVFAISLFPLFVNATNRERYYSARLDSIQVRDRYGTATIYLEYDAQQRVSVIRKSDESMVHHYNYAEDGKLQSVLTEFKGAPYKETIYEYGENGLLMMKRDTFLIDSYPDFSPLYCEIYRYDANGRMTSKDRHCMRRDNQMPSHTRTLYRYDRHGVLREITDMTRKPDDPWNYRIPWDTPMDVVGKGKCDKKGRLMMYHNMQESSRCLYNADALLSNYRSESQEGDAWEFACYHDRCGNVIAIDRIMDDKFIEDTYRATYCLEYDINRVMGFQEGINHAPKIDSFPDHITLPTKNPPLFIVKITNIGGQLSERTTYEYFYTEWK